VPSFVDAELGNQSEVLRFDPWLFFGRRTADHPLVLRTSRAATTTVLWNRGDGAEVGLSRVNDTYSMDGGVKERNG
jgi:hypothetical protein